MIMVAVKAVYGISASVRFAMDSMLLRARWLN
jgi:hypothetical protein